MRAVVAGCAWALLVAAGAAQAQAPIGVKLKWLKSKRQFVLELTNRGSGSFKGYHPSQHMTVAFVVFDYLGNLLKPVGVAKVSPKRRRLKLGPKKSYRWPVVSPVKSSRWGRVWLTHLTGSALFGYKLKKGKRYRILAIYRPKADGGPSYVSPALTIRMPK